MEKIIINKDNQFYITDRNDFIEQHPINLKHIGYNMPDFEDIYECPECHEQYTFDVSNNCYKTKIFKCSCGQILKYNADWK